MSELRFPAAWSVPYEHSKVSKIRFTWPFGVVVIGDGYIEARAQGVLDHAYPRQRISLDDSIKVSRITWFGKRPWQSFEIRSSSAVVPLYILLMSRSAARFERALAERGITLS